LATLASSAFSLPNHLAQGVFAKPQTGSAIVALSGQTPMQFGTSQFMTLTGRPKAQIVAEGAQKSQSQPTFAPINAVPRKAQVTMRFNEEVQWADEDYQIGVLTELSDAAGIALSRAIDLVAIHGINPIDGTALSGSPAKLMDTTNAVEVTGTSKPDDDLTSAVGLTVTDGYAPNGVALDTGFAFNLATVKDTTGRRIYPELGFGIGLTTAFGLKASVTDTVSAPEAAITGGAYATTNPHVKAIIGDFQYGLRWGVQRQIPVTKILYGDPDGSGDLQRNNQIALRAELVFGFGIFDLDAFSKVVDATANS
jgi:HK97 family phage major capsid protein